MITLVDGTPLNLNRAFGYSIDDATALSTVIGFAICSSSGASFA